MASKDDAAPSPSGGGGGEGLAVIHVALFRMATKSMAAAYSTLGYKVHHGIDDILGNPWHLLEEAADATWPDAPGARPRPPFTRRDWDRLFGDEYDIATDMACPFVDQLTQAYPDAKVVIVQRDFDSWWDSYEATVMANLFAPSQRLIVMLVSYVLRSGAARAMAKINYGLFSATSPAEIRANARRTYDAYYLRIRSMIPPERRLEYHMGDGWAPLCEFLGKDVPDVPFPRLNDRKYRRENQSRGQLMVLTRSAIRIAPWALAASAIALPLAFRWWGP